MQGMPELVEQRAGVVEREQRRFARARLGEVHHVDDKRALVAVELLLRSQRRHPGAAALGGTSEIVAEEYAHVPAAGVGHFESAHVRVPDRDILALLKTQSEQAVCRRERRRDHVVEGQIGLELGVIEIAAHFAQLLGVVAPVPWRELEVAAFVADQLLQGVAIRKRALARRAPDLFQKLPHRGWRLGHRVVEPIVGKRRDSRAAARVPSRSAIISAMSALLSVSPPLSPRAIQARNAFSRRSRRREDCRNGSTLERESVMACLPASPRAAASACAACLRNSGKPARSSSVSSSST